MTHSMKKQPKERPAPEDLMVSEASEPLNMYSSVFNFLSMYIEVYNVFSAFFSMYKFKSKLFLASAAVTYLQRAHTPRVEFRFHWS